MSAAFKPGAWGDDPSDPMVLARFILRPTNASCAEEIAAMIGLIDAADGASLARLVRAAGNVAGSETNEPNFDAVLVELQKAVAPFRRLIALPQVGQTVQYFNPSYGASDNEHTGTGPYAAIVTKSWEYGDSVLCNLAIVTPGKDTLAHVGSVPEQNSTMDDARYPSWARGDPA